MRALTESTTLDPRLETPAEHALPVARERALRLAFGATLAFVVALRAATLTLTPLVDTSDSRYAEIAREMTTSGDWITPHLAPGDPFLGKPPLHFWATALAIETFGATELGARLASFVAGLATLAATFFVARRLAGGLVALLASLLLASSALFYELSATCLTDMTLAACSTATLAAFFAALDAPPGSRSERAAFTIGFAGLGLGMLAKGPVAVILVAGTLGLASALSRDWTWLRRVPWIRGGALALAICAPWYLAAEHRSPGFLRYFFVNENLLRFLTPAYGDRYGHGHTHLRGAIVGMLAGAAVPWTASIGVLALAGARGSRWRRLRDDRRFACLAAWAVTPLLFFAASRNVVVTYALPALPPLAIVAAILLRGILEREAARPGMPAHAGPTPAAALRFGGVAALVAVAVDLATRLSHRGVPAAEIALLAGLFTLLACALHGLARPGRVAQAVLATALLIPVIDAAGRLLCSDEIGGYASTRAIARYVETDPARRACALGFFAHRPFSAAYYTGGRARQLPDSAALRAIAAGPSCEWVAIEKKYLSRIDPRDLAGAEVVRDFGGYVLYARRAPADGLSAAAPTDAAPSALAAAVRSSRAASSRTSL